MMMTQLIRFPGMQYEVEDSLFTKWTAWKVRHDVAVEVSQDFSYKVFGWAVEASDQLRKPT